MHLTKSAFLACAAAFQIISRMNNSPIAAAQLIAMLCQGTSNTLLSCHSQIKGSTFHGLDKRKGNMVHLAAHRLEEAATGFPLNAINVGFGQTQQPPLSI